ncbi:MAG: CHASE3 domain-containing protein, partial [Pseudomonadota bacterium]|nr:CHASE3 domain-containing protein [Pseudomonadota bacterium]
MRAQALRRPWILGVLAALGVTVLIGAVLVDNLDAARRRDAAQAWQTHTLRVIADIQHLSSVLQAGEIGERGWLLGGDPAYLALYRSSRHDGPPLIGRLDAETADNPAQRAALQSLRSLIVDREAQMDATLVARSGGGAVTPGVSSAGLATMEAARASLESMAAQENRLLVERTGVEARAEQAG